MGSDVVGLGWGRVPARRLRSCVSRTSIPALSTCVLLVYGGEATPARLKGSASIAGPWLAFCKAYVGSSSLTELPRCAACEAPAPARLPAVLSGIRPLSPMTRKANSGLVSRPLASGCAGYPRSTQTESVTPSASLSTSKVILPVAGSGTRSGKVARSLPSAATGRRIRAAESAQDEAAFLRAQSLTPFLGS
jgi:hypothetical protein